MNWTHAALEVYVALGAWHDEYLRRMEAQDLGVTDAEHLLAHAFQEWPMPPEIPSDMLREYCADSTTSSKAVAAVARARRSM